jgi:hypothetical protein
VTWTEPTGERLAANVAHFARLLHRAGRWIGPGDTLDAQRAVAAVDLLSVAPGGTESTAANPEQAAPPVSSTGTVDPANPARRPTPT